MKTALDVVSSAERIRPVAIVAPMCRSSNNNNNSNNNNWSSPPIASSTAAEHSSAVVAPSAFPSRDPATISLRLPRTPRHISPQTNHHTDAVPLIVVDGRRRSERVSSTKPTINNRRKTKNRTSSGHSSTFADSSSLVQRSNLNNNNSNNNSNNGFHWKSSDLTDEAVRSCNFYYVNLSNEAAKALLETASVGTFLLRDSSDRRFRYSLSVKTPRGATSVRIAESPTSGRFRLDADPQQKSPMSSFASILELVEHYCRLSNGGGNCVVLLESSGRSDMPMVLRRPLELSPAPLAHLCRRLVNRLVDGEERRGRLFDRAIGVGGDGIREEEALRYLFKYPFRV